MTKPNSIEIVNSAWTAVDARMPPVAYSAD